MEVWHVLIRGAICAVGTLLFIQLVADGVEAASVALDRLEARERKAYDRTRGQESGPPAIEVVAA